MTNLVIRSLRNVSRGVLLGALLTFTAVVSAPTVNAQQTIFNVPMANTAERGQTFVELTSTFRPNGVTYSTFLPRVSVGVGRGVELSAGVFETNGQAFGDTTTLQLAGKWRFYNNEETGTALAATSLVSVPLRGEQDKGSVLTFAGLHQTIKPIGLRLSGGVVNGTPHALRADNFVGGWASFEQPVRKGLNVVGEWISGDHRLGAFTPGVSYVRGHHYLRAGYQIFNHDNARNGVALRYGFWF